MFRRGIKWLALLVVGEVLIKLAVDPIVDWLLPGSREENLLLRLLDWLRSPASDLWFGVVLVVPAILWAAAAEGDLTRRERLAFCLPASAGVVAAASYRITSGSIPTTRLAASHDPATWLLLGGLMASLFAVILVGVGKSVQRRCDRNDHDWAAEKFYGNRFGSSGGGTFLICIGRTILHIRAAFHAATICKRPGDATYGRGCVVEVRF